MAFDGTYLKVYEFKEVYFQKSSGGGSPTIVETAFPWPSALTPAAETVTYTWQGGAKRKDITLLIAQRWTLDLAAIPLLGHYTIFGKAEITDAGAADSFFDISTLVGFGGGNDAGGVTVGMRAVANALAGDTETVVEVAVWAPIATLTLTQAGGLQSGQVGSPTQYSISATKTTKDITGANIAGASTDGEFFFIGVGA